MKLPIHLAYERSISPSDVAFLVVWPDGTKSLCLVTAEQSLGLTKVLTRAMTILAQYEIT